MEEDGEEQDEGETEEGGNAETYQHIKEAKKRLDTQTLDAATEVSCFEWFLSLYSETAKCKWERSFCCGLPEFCHLQQNVRLIVMFTLLFRNCTCADA